VPTTVDRGRVAPPGDDASLVERTARDLIAEHGRHAGDFVKERAEAAEALGDGASAQIWREISEAIERLRRSDLDPLEPHLGRLFMATW
jgi:hypothetical protein